MILSVTQPYIRYSSQQQIFSYYHFHAHQQQQQQQQQHHQQQHQQHQFQIGQHILPQIRHQPQQRQKHHAQKETTVRRRPVSAAAVVESAPTPTSRRPVFRTLFCLYISNFSPNYLI